MAVPVDEGFERLRKVTMRVMVSFDYSEMIQHDCGSSDKQSKYYACNLPPFLGHSCMARWLQHLPPPMRQPVSVQKFLA
jgi:hypothetical protein